MGRKKKKPVKKNKFLEKCIRKMKTFGRNFVSFGILACVNLAYLYYGSKLFQLLEFGTARAAAVAISVLPRTVAIKVHGTARDPALPLCPQIGVGNMRNRAFLTAELISLETQEERFYKNVGNVQAAPGRWSDNGAFIYVFQICTTIGWGNVTPESLNAKMLTIAYSIFGIPLLYTLSTYVTDYFNRFLNYLLRRLKQIWSWITWCFKCDRIDTESSSSILDKADKKSGTGDKKRGNPGDKTGNWGSQGDDITGNQSSIVDLGQTVVDLGQGDFSQEEKNFQWELPEKTFTDKDVEKVVKVFNKHQFDEVLDFMETYGFTHEELLIGLPEQVDIDAVERGGGDSHDRDEIERMRLLSNLVFWDEMKARRHTSQVDVENLTQNNPIGAFDDSDRRYIDGNDGRVETFIDFEDSVGLSVIESQNKVRNRAVDEEILLKADKDMCEKQIMDNDSRINLVKGVTDLMNGEDRIECENDLPLTRLLRMRKDAHLTEMHELKSHKRRGKPNHHSRCNGNRQDGREHCRYDATPLGADKNEISSHLKETNLKDLNPNYEINGKNKEHQQSEHYKVKVQSSDVRKETMSDMSKPKPLDIDSSVSRKDRTLITVDSTGRQDEDYVKPRIGNVVADVTNVKIGKTRYKDLPQNKHKTRKTDKQKRISLQNSCRLEHNNSQCLSAEVNTIPSRNRQQGHASSSKDEKPHNVSSFVSKHNNGRRASASQSKMDLRNCIRSPMSYDDKQLHERCSRREVRSIEDRWKSRAVRKNANIPGLHEHKINESHNKPKPYEKRPLSRDKYVNNRECNQRDNNYKRRQSLGEEKRQQLDTNNNTNIKGLGYAGWESEDDTMYDVNLNADLDDLSDSEDSFHFDEDLIEEPSLPLAINICFLFIYVALGALVYSFNAEQEANTKTRMENVIENFYFIYITFSTIGFGDIKPNKDTLWLLFFLIYGYFGVALFTQVISNCLQFIDSFFERVFILTHLAEVPQDDDDDNK